MVKFIIGGSAALVGILVAFYLPSEAQREPAQAKDSTYKVSGVTIPLHNLESIPSDEAPAIAATNQLFVDFFKKFYLDHSPQTDSGSGLTLKGTRRGVHPKAHGCLNGTLQVLPDIGPQDRVGIFKDPGRTYKVLARFSNGNSRTGVADSVADARGFGLKVYGVEGEPLLSGLTGEDGHTQEFAMVSGNTFFSDTAARYYRFMQIALQETADFGAAAENFIKELAFKRHPILAYRVFKAFQTLSNVHATNPLSIPYFAISPFQHGAGNDAPVVKYSLVPCDGPWTEAADQNDPNFLRNNLKKYISAKPACFYFMVQNRLDNSMPVENPTILWDTKKSPYRKIARVDLPAQTLVDELACEQAVINPWNTLPEHKPMGGINRLRLAAYLMSIQERKATNGY